MDIPQPIYLASKSPRRAKLLQQLNINFIVVECETNEELRKNERPSRAVIRIAQEKMNAALQKVNNGIILTADTIVVYKGKKLGKPANPAEAVKMLRFLSSKTHSVYTGFSVFNPLNNKRIDDYVKTDVTFRRLSSDEIEEYVNGGSPLDKAGAYGIQDDFGAVFIEKINGCYYNVVGLPLSRVYHALLSVI